MHFTTKIAIIMVGLASARIIDNSNDIGYVVLMTFLILMLLAIINKKVEI